MLGGILAGALSGGAQAGGQIADTEIKQRNDTAMRELESKLAVEREAQVARLRESIRREGVIYDTTGEGGQAKLKYGRQEGQQKNELEVEGEKQMGPVRAANEAAKTREVEGAKTDVTKQRGSDKAFLGAQQNIADASESRSTKSARAASTAGQNLENQMKRDMWDLEQQRRKAIDAGDTAAVERIEAKQRSLSKKASDEGYDITKVIEEEDPLTGEVKRRTETTSRRPASAAPANKPQQAPAGGAPYKDGTILRRGNELFIVRDGKPVPYSGK
jgi:hypothetical protein